jgi:hypothetical protein
MIFNLKVVAAPIANRLSVVRFLDQGCCTRVLLRIPRTSAEEMDS